MAYLAAAAVVLLAMSYALFTTLSEPAGSQDIRSSPTLRPSAEQVPAIACRPSSDFAEPQVTSLAVADEFDLETRPVDDEVSLTYIDPWRALLVGSGDHEFAIVTLFGDRAGTVVLGDDAPSAAAAAYHPLLREYFAWRSDAEFVTAHAAEPDGMPSSEGSDAIDLRGLAIGDLAQLAVAPTTGDLFLRDTENSPILRVPFDPAGARRSGGAFDLAASCQLRATLPPGTDVGPMAVDPISGHIFVFGIPAAVLYELTPDGRLVAEHPIGDLGLGRPVGAAFAPPANPRHGARPGLVVVDAASGAAESARVVEIALGPSAEPPIQHVALVSAMRTRDWLPPSVDPGGVAYDALTDRLVVTDPEIDELPLYAGSNLFQVGLSGGLVRTGLTRFVAEPTGVIVDPETGDYYVTDDADARVYRFGRGEDEHIGTDDDTASSFSTVPFGVTDVEGIAAGQASLFLAGGADGAIYRMSAGPDREFEGGSPTSDDSITRIDVAGFGIGDPEAIEYDPVRGTLYLVADDPARLVEIGTDGSLIQTIDLSFLPLISPSGLALGPSSDDPARRSLYLVDRGLDRTTDPNQRDGLLVELRIEDGPAPGLLRNGGFEEDIDDDAAPDGWELDGGALLEGSDAHSGERAVVLTSIDSEAAAHYEIPIPESHDPPTAYSVGAWFRTLAGPNASITIRIAWRDATGVRLTTDRIVLASGPEWTDARSTLTAPPGTVSARITLEAAVGTTLAIDDVSFEAGG